MHNRNFGYEQNSPMAHSSPKLAPTVHGKRPAHRPAPSTAVRPFIKWAGGKRQLLAQFSHCYPPQLETGQIRRVVEPFVGSGAVFLSLAQQFGVAEFVINDANPEIARLYLVLQRAPQRFIEALGDLQARYWRLDEAARRTFYYEVRAAYNVQRAAAGLALLPVHRMPDLWVQRAVWTIFLNKTCFNGLFRVNSKGEFNVPFGRYTRPAICDAQNLLAVAQILQNTEILNTDFSGVEQWIDEETFVYFDPPYRPLNATSTFTAYAAGGFDESEQTRLARFFARLHHTTGARLMLSNSDPANIDPDDRFFDELYADFSIRRVQAKRAINAKAANRGEISELVITNY